MRAITVGLSESAASHGAMHGLSLQQSDYLVPDRLSWMWFCGLGCEQAPALDAD